MTASDFDDYFLLPVVAGDETTGHTISQSMLALSENQDQLRILQERPGLINSAVEGVPPLGLAHLPLPAHRDLRRRTRRQTDQEGQQVFMWFASGNRAADVVNDPYQFDVTRTNVDHVTFGRAARACAWAAPWPG